MTNRSCNYPGRQLRRDRADARLQTQTSSGRGKLAQGAMRSKERACGRRNLGGARTYRYLETNMARATPHPPTRAVASEALVGLHPARRKRVSDRPCLQESLVATTLSSRQGDNGWKSEDCQIGKMGHVFSLTCRGQAGIGTPEAPPSNGRRGGETQRPRTLLEVRSKESRTTTTSARWRARKRATKWPSAAAAADRTRSPTSDSHPDERLAASPASCILLSQATGPDQCVSSQPGGAPLPLFDSCRPPTSSQDLRATMRRPAAERGTHIGRCAGGLLGKRTARATPAASTRSCRLG